MQFPLDYFVSEFCYSFKKFHKNEALKVSFIVCLFFDFFVCMFVCVCFPLCMFVCVYVSLCVCLFVCMFPFVYVCLCVMKPMSTAP